MASATGRTERVSVPTGLLDYGALAVTPVWESSVKTAPFAPMAFVTVPGTHSPVPDVNSRISVRKRPKMQQYADRKERAFQTRLALHTASATWGSMAPTVRIK